MTSAPATRCTCLTEAWDAHEAELRAWALRETGDPGEAGDLLSEVFVRALRLDDRFCEVEHVRAWLFTTARRLQIDRFRTRKSVVPMADAPAPEVDEAPAVDGLTACLPRALGELEPTDADILRSCDLGGMTQAAYAAAVGISVPGAKSRLQRARVRLKEQLSTACRVSLDDSGAVCCFVPRAPKET